MAGVLNIQAVFGVKANVRNNVHFVEDNVVVYPAGNYIVKNYTSTRQQEFMPCTDNTGGVTAMAVSSSRRYVAVAERTDGPDGATISVFNVRTLNKRRGLNAMPHLLVAEYGSLCFNLDDTLILGLTGSPAYQVVLFSVDKGRAVGYTSAISAAVLALVQIGSSPIPYSCSFSPVSLTKAVVNGRGMLSFYSIDELAPGSAASAAAGSGSEGPDGDSTALTHAISSLPQNGAFQTRALKLGSSTPGTDYSAHCWMGDDISVAATGAGDILLFKRDQYLRVLDNSPRDGKIVDAMASFSRGFVTAGEGGLVRVYEYTDTEDTSKFACVKTLRATALGLDCEDRIRSIGISPSEEVAALSMSGCQLIAFDLAHANVKDDSNAFTPLGPLSHAPPTSQGCGPGHRPDACAVLGLDVAVRKPLIATVGVDNTVRVWNYLERSCEVSKVFPEGPTSVAFHPSGVHLLVGFSDKLRLLNVLMEDIREVKDFPIKSCVEVRFSHGGDLFAAVNGNVVQVYSTYTGEYVQTLRGHNGRVTCVQWAPNDATLLSCSSDGAIYEWDMLDAKRARDFFVKGVRWHSLSASKDSNLVYAVGDGAGEDGEQCALREIDMTSGSVIRECILPMPFNAIMYSLSTPKMLFVSSACEGRTSLIRSYALPLTDTPSFVEYTACSTAISHMAVSHDDSHIFAAASDGSVLVYEVRDKDGRLPMSEFAVKMPWADEVLVTISDLEDKKNTVRDLRDHVAELQSNNDYAMRMMDIMFQEKLKKITEHYTSELETERQQFDLLREEKLDLEREYTERMNSMEVAHRSEMQKRESLYQGKIMEEVERYQSLQSDVDSQRAMWQKKRDAMTAAHRQYMTQLTGDYERRLEAARDRRRELEDEVEGVKRDWEEMRHQMEDDLDKEVEGMKRGYQEKLDAERDSTLKFKGENGIMMKKFAALTKEKDEISEEIKRMTAKHKDLRSQIQDLEKEIQMLRVTIHEKDVGIAEKEKRIYELKKKNQELEKFKFVLDYKIKELKQQIEPRENEIAAMKKQIKEVDAELEAYHKSNAELDELIGKLRGQLDTLQTAAGKLRGSLIRKDAAVKDFSGQLHDVIHTATTPETLSVETAKLFALHVRTEELTAKSDGSVISESERQRSHLSEMLGHLKGRAEEQAEVQKRSNLTLIDENMNLIGQIKQLRDQVTALKGANRVWHIDRQRAIAMLHSVSIVPPTNAIASSLGSAVPSGRGDSARAGTSSRGMSGGVGINSLTAGSAAGFPKTAESSYRRPGTGSMVSSSAVPRSPLAPAAASADYAPGFDPSGKPEGHHSPPARPRFPSDGVNTAGGGGGVSAGGVRAPKSPFKGAVAHVQTPQRRSGEDTMPEFGISSTGVKAGVRPGTHHYERDGVIGGLT